MKQKRKTYDSEREFEADRKKMWAKGWLVVERKTMPLARPSLGLWAKKPVACVSSIVVLAVVGWQVYREGSAAPLGTFVALVLLLGIVWLMYRLVPEKQVLVTYERDEERQ